MTEHTFIICGYGIPEDMARDDNYSTYLHVVFNRMFERARGARALIVHTGGPTKCVPPHEGTEAGAMAAYFSGLMERAETVAETRGWRVVPEEESLSTLENLLFAKRVIEAEGGSARSVIFCEKTREVRVQRFAEEIFGGEATVIAIDFDVSKNRYLAPDVLAKREARVLREGLWTLEDSERIARHHEFFEKKFAYLCKRESEGLSHVDAVQEWFEKQEEVIQELMPDHPMFRERVSAAALCDEVRSDSSTESLT